MRTLFRLFAITVALIAPPSVARDNIQIKDGNPIGVYYNLPHYSGRGFIDVAVDKVQFKIDGIVLPYVKLVGLHIRLHDEGSQVRFDISGGRMQSEGSAAWIGAGQLLATLYRNGRPISTSVPINWAALGKDGPYGLPDTSTVVQASLSSADQLLITGAAHSRFLLDDDSHRSPGICTIIAGRSCEDLAVDAAILAVRAYVGAL